MFGGFLKPSSRVLCAHTGKATANNVTGASEIHFLENIRYSSPLQSRYLVTVLLDLFTKRASTTLHSRFANHSAIRGGVTRLAGAGVSPNLLNLFTSRPEKLPMATTLGASSSARIAPSFGAVASRTTGSKCTECHVPH